MSGWCIANTLPLRPRERVCCMIAATAADVDGLGILISGDLYRAYHHILGHNLFFALLVSITLALFSRPLITLWVYLLLAHLHLVMDYFGSGPLWDIYYLWPVSRWRVRFDGAWEFFSWQNITVAAVFLVWTIVIAVRCRRTPLEVLMPSLDRQLVELIDRKAGEVGRRRDGLMSRRDR